MFSSFLLQKTLFKELLNHTAALVLLHSHHAKVTTACCATLSGVSQLHSLKCLQTEEQADDHLAVGAWPRCDRAALTWRRESLIWKQLRITRHHYTTPLTGISNLLSSSCNLPMLALTQQNQRVSLGLMNSEILAFWLEVTPTHYKTWLCPSHTITNNFWGRINTH